MGNNILWNRKCSWAVAHNHCSDIGPSTVLVVLRSLLYDSNFALQLEDNCVRVRPSNLCSILIAVYSCA